MTRKMDRRLMDANAFVMGSGPSLAVLESMFNLVTAQSVLSASMVRDHELNQPLMMDALAFALSDILDPCRPRVARCRCARGAVPVDFPGGEPGQAVRSARRAPPGGNGNGAGNGGDNPEALFKTSSFVAAPSQPGPTNADSSIEDLVQTLKALLEQAGSSNTTTTTKTSESVTSGGDLEPLMHDVLTMLGEHLADITQNTRQTLMVT